MEIIILNDLDFTELNDLDFTELDLPAIAIYDAFMEHDENLFKRFAIERTGYEYLQHSRRIFICCETGEGYFAIGDVQNLPKNVADGLTFSKVDGTDTASGGTIKVYSTQFKVRVSEDPVPVKTIYQSRLLYGPYCDEVEYGFTNHRAFVQQIRNMPPDIKVITNNGDQMHPAYQASANVAVYDLDGMRITLVNLASLIRYNKPINYNHLAFLKNKFANFHSRNN